MDRSSCRHLANDRSTMLDYCEKYFHCHRQPRSAHQMRQQVVIESYNGTWKTHVLRGMWAGRQEFEWGGVGNVEAAPCGYLLHQPHWVEWVDGDRPKRPRWCGQDPWSCWMLSTPPCSATVMLLSSLPSTPCKRMYRGLEKVVKDAKSAVGCGLGGKGKLRRMYEEVVAVIP